MDMQHKAPTKTQAPEGVDPYNTARMRKLSLETITEEQRKEATGILACYETELTLQGETHEKA
jgi:hypothetical protein